MKQIKIHKKLLENNDEIAHKNREVLKEQKIYTINLLGSPGAGKTSILEQIVKYLKECLKIKVIEGDLYTIKDASRIESHGIDVVQLNTLGACHLDASMIDKALGSLGLGELDLLVIENVGNLVCPASYDLGEDIKIIVLSVTEGDDKPLKYPAMFQRAKAVILNKVDLLEHTNFNEDMFYHDVKAINKDIKIFRLSCTTGEGVEDIGRYLYEKVMNKRNKL